MWNKIQAKSLKKEISIRKEQKWLNKAIDKYRIHHESTKHGELIGN